MPEALTAVASAKSFTAVGSTLGFIASMVSPTFSAVLPIVLPRPARAETLVEVAPSATSTILSMPLDAARATSVMPTKAFDASVRTALDRTFGASPMVSIIAFSVAS